MRPVEVGDPAAPCAVVAHGAGSTSRFVLRAFARALTGAGYRLLTWDEPSGDPLPALAELAQGTRARLVGGISLGAHAAATWASGRDDLDGVLAVLPGWLGPPDAAAALTAAAADDVDRLGVAGALARMRAEGAAPAWVADEMADAWPDYGDRRLAEVFRRTAAASAPDPPTLARVGVPVGLVAFDEDPLHPLTAARGWLAELPRAALEVVGLQAPAADRGVLGAAAVTAWRKAALSGPR